MSTETNMFNIQVVSENFEAALHEEDDVHLQYYLDSYEELNKFFSLIGSVFGFVSSDLMAKIDLLNQFLKDSEKTEHFVTVKKMIDYEKTNNLLNKNDYVSGARTLLRLHRGLDFIQTFLKKLSDLQHEENTSSACREAYDLTLAKYHPFIVKTCAKVAIYTLPTKGVLLKWVCGEPEQIQRAMELLPKTLELTTIVYNRIDTLYTVHNLHKLP